MMSIESFNDDDDDCSPSPVDDDQDNDENGDELARCRGNKDVIGKFSLRNIMSFDPLRLQSTCWRNRRMSSLVMNDTAGDAKVTSVLHYGVDVRFSPGRFHYTAAELEPYRKVGDPEMDYLLEYLTKTDGVGAGGRCGAFDDIIANAANDYRLNIDSPICKFYTHYYENVPDWVDYDEIQRGIDVFLAYLPAAGCALFYRSLVGGFSIPKIAVVLVATRYLVPSEGGYRSKEAMDRERKRSEERLIDTGGFLACCFAPPPSSSSSDGNNGNNDLPSAAASLRPGGRGWTSALRVRVLHAKVRRSLLRRSDPRWDVDANGVPINQEDMIATLLAFSVNVLLGIELASGRPLNGRDQRDYLALWRYLGWLLGVDTPEETTGRWVATSSNGGGFGDKRLVPIDPCGPRRSRYAESYRSFDGSSIEWDPNADVVDLDDDPIIHSYGTLESIILHLLHPEQSSRLIVNHLLNLRRSIVFRSEVCRKFLGDSLSDQLGIPKSQTNWVGWRIASLHNFVSHVCIKIFLYIFLVFLRGYTLLTMACPLFRQRAIVWHGNLEGKFLCLWEKSHEDRVTKAASKLEVGVAKSTTKKKSLCPFAMIMDPNSGNGQQVVVEE